MNASKPSYIFNLCWILRENYSSKHLFDHCMGTLICCIIAGIVFSCFTEPLLFCCDLYKYQLLSLTHNQWCHPIDDCCINVHKVTLALAWQWVGLSFICTWNSKSAGVLWVFWISQCKVIFLTSVLCSCYAQ